MVRKGSPVRVRKRAFPRALPDLVDRLERVVRAHILQSLPEGAAPDLDHASLASLLIEYRTWRGRFVRPLPRNVYLHLSTALDADGFVTRSGDVLFVAVTGTDAYLLDIRKHEKDGDNWAAQAVFAILVRNWPRSGLVRPFEGLGVSQRHRDDARRELHAASTTSLMEIDGKVYAPGGVGQTTAGTPIGATQAANEFTWALRSCPPGLLRASCDDE
jgi:hypothetical protein